MICLDLRTDAVLWKKKYGKYADSMAITPDGRTMYLPFRDESAWWVINADDGAVITKIETIKPRSNCAMWLSPDNAVYAFLP